jgi:ATP phosphoribosyltransferase
VSTIRIALSKGRLQSPSLAICEAAGFVVPTFEELSSRKLVFRKGGFEWVFVKDSDVTVYVDHGAADIGIAGLDQIVEQDCDAYQPVGFRFGACRMMVIGAPEAGPIEGAVSVATKYPRIARDFLQRRSLRAEVVTLGGSLELAAVLNLTSHIIDLVETGETARIHNLQLQETILDISPRLLVSRGAYRTEPARVRDFVARIGEAAEKEVYV